MTTSHYGRRSHCITPTYMVCPEGYAVAPVSLPCGVAVMPTMQVVLCASAPARLGLLSTSLRPTPAPAAASTQQALPGFCIVAEEVFHFCRAPAPAPALEGWRLELEGAIPYATRQVDGNACAWAGGAGWGGAWRVRQEGKEEGEAPAAAAAAVRRCSSPPLPGLRQCLRQPGREMW